MTSYWARERLKSPASRLFTQSFIQTQIKETSKFRVTGLCAGNSPGTGEFPAQMASNAENVSIWWRHHGIRSNSLVLFIFIYSHITLFIMLCSRLVIFDFINIRQCYSTNIGIITQLRRFSWLLLSCIFNRSDSYLTNSFQATSNDGWGLVSLRAKVLL